MKQPRAILRAIVLNIPSILLFAAFAAAPAPAQVPSGRTASSRDVEMKVTLESVMEKRLETVLRKILASDEIFVVANVELLDDSERPEVEVLPGVVVKKTPASAAPMELPASLVKRVTLSVFVAHSMSGANVDLARATVERMVGLKPERGDVLNVEKVGAPPEKTASFSSFLDQTITPKTALLLTCLLICLLAACWGLVHVSRRFFDPFLSVLREAIASLMKALSQQPGAQKPDGTAVDAAAKSEHDASPSTNGTGSSDRRLPFSFLKERDLPALELLLLEQSDAAAAIIVQYLAPAFASRILSTMTAARREKVLSYMSKPALLNQLEVTTLEETILSKVDYIMGGEEKLVMMLDSASIAMQAAILETVRRHSPDLGARLDRRVVLLEDIGLLDEAGLTALSREATVRGMAIVLKLIPQLRDKVLPKLKTGLGEWLSQETALLGDLPEQVKEAEMRRVLQALTRLVREGKIVLRKSIPSPFSHTGTEISTNGAQ